MGQGVQLTVEPKSPAFNMELLAAEHTSVATQPCFDNIHVDLLQSIKPKQHTKSLQFGQELFRVWDNFLNRLDVIRLVSETHTEYQRRTEQEVKL